jgi:hypothetical protein
LKIHITPYLLMIFGYFSFSCNKPYFVDISGTIRHTF